MGRLIRFPKVRSKPARVCDTCGNLALDWPEAEDFYDGNNRLSTHTYDAFGVLLDRTGTTEKVYLFTGEQWDPNAGFYYLRARYLNPEFGRFVTLDPFEGIPFDPKTLHKYLYANGDPVNNVDPSGMFTITGSLQEVTVVSAINSVLATVTTFAVVELLRRTEPPLILNHYTDEVGLSNIIVTNVIKAPFNSKTFYSPDFYSTATLARIRLALPKLRDIRITLFLFRRRDELFGPRKVYRDPKIEGSGGGTEYWTFRPVPFWSRIITFQKLPIQ